MLEPLNDRVLVKLVEEEEKTAGGIVLPDTAKEKPTKGIVQAVGPGRLLENGKRQPIAVKKGDKVIFSKYGGTEFKDGDVEYMILREEDIYAIISSEAKPAKPAKAAAKRKS
jgi:chaperonin GroES